MAKKDDAIVKRLSTALTAKGGQVRGGQHEEGATFRIRRINAGKLVLPTGRICLTDAYSADEYPSLNYCVPPGEYSVELVIAELPENLPFGNDRCAFAIVAFSDDKVQTWAPVTAVSAAEPCFTDERPNGIIQEGGTGLFSPEAGAVHFAHLREQFDDQVKTIRNHAKKFGSNDWINYRPGQEPANVLIVEGGMGDGTAECFVGLNKIGRVTRLVIDFGIYDPSVT